MSKSKSFRIGVDLGGTNISVGLVDSENKIISRYSCKTSSERSYIEIITDICKACEEVVRLVDKNMINCEYVGIGSPGIVDKSSGNVIYSCNLSWSNVPLTSIISEKLGIPAYASNDANCAVLGEAVAGAAKGMTNVILITIGTGIGGGVIIDGKIFEGGKSGGTEIGHTSLVVDGEQCNCGRKGCFEVYASANALVRTALKTSSENKDSLLHSMYLNEGEMNGRIPFEAAKLGDDAAIAVVNNYIKYLGEGIVNMVNIFRPDIVLLSGGVSEQGEFLTNPLDEYMLKYSYAGSKIFIPEIKKATLGNDAGIIGAANLFK